MDNRILIFCKPGCSFCDKAKDFLKSLELPFYEVKLDPLDVDYEQKRDNLFKTYNHYSYPIIIINNEYLGGYNDLIIAYETLKLHNLCKKMGIEIAYNF